MSTRAEINEELDGLFAGSTTPRVDGVIRAMMKRFPGVGRESQHRFYEEVHQVLGPLARELETENASLRQEIADLREQIQAAWRNGVIARKPA